MNRKERTYKLLNNLNISYRLCDHESIDTMEGLKKIEDLLAVSICKNLLLCNRQQTSFYLLMMPGDKKFKTKELSHQIYSSRLSFSDNEHMLEYLDILPGSLSVLGLMNDKENHVQLLIDEDILKKDYIGVHPCDNTSTLKIRIEDIIEVFLPYVKHNYQIVHLLGE